MVIPLTSQPTPSTTLVNNVSSTNPLVLVKPGHNMAYVLSTLVPPSFTTVATMFMLSRPLSPVFRTLWTNSLTRYFTSTTLLPSYLLPPTHLAVPIQPLTGLTS